LLPLKDSIALRITLISLITSSVVKEKLSTETSGILLFYPTDNIPIGIDLHFDSFYNSKDKRA
jgi:hypothetical protein